MDDYVNLLRRLFKGSDTAIVFACVYMTGILPIKKYGTQSALNDFREFSMTSPDMLIGYIGFVAEEVRMLCDKYGMDYDEMKGWYDGYSFGQEYPSLFNPNSVMEACKRHVFANYWAKTEAFESLQQYIDLNMTGIKETLEGIVLGKKQKVRALRFGFDVKTIDSDEELMTLLIHLGYLSYNFDDMTVHLPNKEIRMEFVEALRGSKTHKELSVLIKSSDRLVEATMNKDERIVAEIIEQLHTSTAGPDFYNNEQALRSVLKIGYLSAIDDFVSIQELPTGKGRSSESRQACLDGRVVTELDEVKGYADLALIPRRGSQKPAVGS